MTPAEECFAKEFEPYVPGYRSRRAVDRDLLGRAKSALLEALTITQELPRSHWVWQPGYAVQTVNLYRFKDFCRFRFREDPCDELALWARIGHSLRGDAPEFGEDAFRALRDREGFDVAWPIYAACFVQRIWATSDSLKLGPFLRESNLLLEAEATISAIREQRDPYIDSFETEGFDREEAARCIEIALAEEA